MAQPSTRQGLIDYCKRQLGAPVLQINIDDDQVSDIIDDAIQFYHEHHFDGLERMYLKHQITADDVTRFTSSDETNTTPAPDAAAWENRNNFLEVPDHVIGIQNVFGVSSNWVRNDLFGLSNQYFLMDIFSFSSGFAFGNFDMTNYYMIRQYFETLDMVVNTGNLVQYRFTKRQDRLFIDIDVSRLEEGNYLLIDCWRAVDPDTFTQVYNDSFLKRYATALMKRQWGANLIKYNNVQLPGGITLNGRQIWEDGNNEVKELESQMLTTYSLPPMDMIG
ncbi:MAG: hypothetical protein ACO3CD_06530 [Candidatus Nanopelagicaceae bacterium]